MPTRSGVLARFVSPNGALAILGTVPSTDSWIVKDIGIYNSTGVTQLVQLYLANAAGTIVRILFAGNIAATASVSITHWALAGPGDTINAIPGAAGIHYWVSGADLPGHL